MQDGNTKPDIMNIGIGIEQPKAEPGKYLVHKAIIETVEVKGQAKDKVNLTINSKGQEIHLNKAKIEKGNQTKVQGIWISLDKDNKLMHGSTLAAVLRHYKKEYLSQMEGVAVDTVLDESGYLVLKAY